VRIGSVRDIEWKRVWLAVLILYVVLIVGSPVLFFYFG